MEKLLTISEAATLLNVHPETLRRWDREGTLKALKVNDRGDRRYKESELLDFMNVNPDLIQYGQIGMHKKYSIKWDSQGFIGMPANFGLVARIIAYTDDKIFIGFAFAVDGLSLFARTNEENNLDKLALDKVKEYIDNETLSNDDMYTFEFKNGEFLEVQNPEWWHGKYSKSLVSGLRVEAHSTHPVTSLQNAWRVILHFRSQEGDFWPTRTFGPNNSFHEYFVWIDSEELLRVGLSNTAKSAEIIAVNFGIKRFNETRDSEGNRDIERIGENNTAFYNGKYIRDSVLPDEIYERK